MYACGCFLICIFIICIVQCVLYNVWTKPIFFLKDQIKLNWTQLKQSMRAYTLDENKYIKNMPNIYRKYIPTFYFQNIFDGEKYIKNMMKYILKIW